MANDSTSEERRQFFGLVLAVLCSIVLTFLLSATIVVATYGGETLWPEFLSTVFGAFIGFGAAVWVADWADKRRLGAEVRRTKEHASTEARRRMTAISQEMEHLRESIGVIATKTSETTVAPRELPIGVWTASQGYVVALIADYGLVAEVATFYARVEELRWRMRFFAEADFRGRENRQREVFALTTGLASDLIRELDGDADHGGGPGLLKRVSTEAGAPSIQSTGLLHRGRANLGLRAGVSVGAKPGD